MENTKMVLICDCHSMEHQISFWVDPEDGDVIVDVHLTTHRNFFKRLWVGIKYAFGYKSRYGAWDEFIFQSF